MASIHRKKLRSGRTVWELTHGRGPERIRFIAGDTRDAADGLLAQFKRQLAEHGSAPQDLSVPQAVRIYREYLHGNRRSATTRRYARTACRAGVDQPEKKAGSRRSWHRRRRFGQRVLESALTFGPRPVAPARPPGPWPPRVVGSTRRSGPVDGQRSVRVGQPCLCTPSPVRSPGHAAPASSEPAGGVRSRGHRVGHSQRSCPHGTEASAVCSASVG